MTAAATNKILFVHGYGTDESVWEHTLELFDDCKEAVTVTLPGHGGGGKKWYEPTFKPGVEVVLEAARKEDAPVIGVGWSLGAEVLLASYVASPEVFKAFVLVSATPSYTQRDGFPWAQRRGLARKSVQDMTRDPVGTLKWFYERFFTPGEKRTPATGRFLKHFAERAKKFDHDSLVLALKAIMDGDLRGTLGAVKVPTLIIHGTSDLLCPPGAGRYLNENIANSRLDEIDGTGHAPFITKPELFVELLKGFLSRL